MEVELLARSEQESIPQLSAGQAPQSSDKTTALALVSILRLRSACPALGFRINSLVLACLVVQMI